MGVYSVGGLGVGCFVTEVSMDHSPEEGNFMKSVSDPQWTMRIGVDPGFVLVSSNAELIEQNDISRLLNVTKAM